MMIYLIMTKLALPLLDLKKNLNSFGGWIRRRYKNCDGDGNEDGDGDGDGDDCIGRGQS